MQSFSERALPGVTGSLPSNASNKAKVLSDMALFMQSGGIENPRKE